MGRLHDIGRLSHGPSGPRFRPHLDAGANEYADAPGLLRTASRCTPRDYITRGPWAAFHLAKQVIAAAQGPEAHR